jgi:hypothetical protein
MSMVMSLAGSVREDFLHAAPGMGVAPLKCFGEKNICHFRIRNNDLFSFSIVFVANAFIS